MTDQRGWKQAKQLAYLSTQQGMVSATTLFILSCESRIRDLPESLLYK